MHASANIPPSDLLLAYLAGELDDVQETLLFSKLAENTDLRNELRDYLVIDSLVRRDTDTILPPASLKSSTMNAVAAIKQPEQQKRIAPLWTLPRVLGLSVLSAFLGGVLAVALMYSVQERTVGTAQFRTAPAPDVVVTPNPAVASSAVAGPDIGNSTQSERIFPRGLSSSLHRGEQQRDIPPSAKNSDGAKSIAAPQSAAPVALITPSAYAETLSYATAPGSITLSDASVEELPPAGARSLFAQPLMPAGFRADIRGMAMRSLQTTDVPSQSSPWFNNISVGLMYDLSERNSIGVEVGQEAFTQVYSGTDNGRRATFEQKPLLLWVGGVYQHTLGSIDELGGIRPFGRIVAGGTAVGPIARGIAGLQCTPDTRVSLWLGAEGSLLMYRFQDAWFTSNKVGVSYGMSIAW